MCSQSSSNNLPAYFAASDWIEALLQEYEDEAKEEARWPILLLQSANRKLMWHLCATLKVSSKGIPGNACRLMERYLSRNIRSYFQVLRGMDEWNRYKTFLESRTYLLAVSCIQLAAKMTDLTVPLSATVVRSALLREGIMHSKSEIVDMEFHVYSTLDFRIPLWTSLEAAEFMAIYIGMGTPTMIKAVGLIINLSEYSRDLLELHLRYWSEVYNTPGLSSSTGSWRCTLGTVFMAAGGVCAAARFLRAPDPALALSALTRTAPRHIRVIADIIGTHIIPDQRNRDFYRGENISNNYLE